MIMLKPAILRWFALVAAVLLGTGCAKGLGDLQAKVEEIKAREGTPIEPLPVMRTFETFEYNAQSLRDPFSPSADDDVQAAQGPRPDMDRPREPLESYPLDTLDMVGTLGLGADMTALVKDPDGIIHQIRADNYLGQNYGRVTAIFEDRIDLVELIPNGVGGWNEKPASIALADQ